jgi:hypothetical protein
VSCAKNLKEQRTPVIAVVQLDQEKDFKLVLQKRERVNKRERGVGE